MKAARKNVKHAPQALHNGSIISELQRERDVCRRAVIHTYTNWDKDFSRANGAAGLELE